MKGARLAAWNVYIYRIERMAQEQFELFEKGYPSRQIVMAPPDAKDETIVQQAIDEAVLSASLEMISKVLQPIVSALDAIDNSRTKVPAMKECYKKLESVYDELHALKVGAAPPDHTEKP